MLQELVIEDTEEADEVVEEVVDEIIVPNYLFIYLLKKKLLFCFFCFCLL